MKKRDKEVEYRETEVFELFPKFTYTPRQKKRITLFHDYANHYKKIIRYAQNFDEPNKICLVYLVGETKPGVVEAELESSGCSDRVCVLTSEFPDEAMRIWKEYEEGIRKKYQPGGFWDNEKGEPAEWYLTERKQIADYYYSNMQGGMDGQMSLMGAGEDYDTCVNQTAEYEAFIAAIDRYKKLREKCGTVYFRNFRLHRRGHLEKPYTHERLDSLIQKIFPQGAESMGVNNYVAISPASIEPTVAWAITGEPNKKIGMTDSMTEPTVKALVRQITNSIAERGYCTLNELHDIGAAPPYGLAYDGYSAACVVKALRHFGHRTLIFFDGCSHFEAKGLEETAFDLTFGLRSKTRIRRYNDACLYLESQPHKKVKQFMSRLWGIKIEMPGQLMGLHLGKQLCKTHRVPLRYVDERLLHLTLWDIDFWDRTQVEALAGEIAAHGGEILENYKRYQYENSHVPDRAKSLLRTDYSWAWSNGEYERILRETEIYGPWPWDEQTARKKYLDEWGVG